MVKGILLYYEIIFLCISAQYLFNQKILETKIEEFNKRHQKLDSHIMEIGVITSFHCIYFYALCLGAENVVFERNI
jgi:hypothetical protein